MTFFFRLPLLLVLSLLLLVSSLPLSVAHAEAVYNPNLPVKKKRKKHLRTRRLTRKQAQKKPDNIVFGLYITFSILILLPVLVLLGVFLVAFGFPALPFYIVGASLIGLGNIGIILAGLFTGKTATYNTQALYFSAWVFFGINLAAVFVFALLYATVFIGATLLLFLTIGVAIVALVFLFWAVLIARKKRIFKRASQLDIPK